MMKIAAKKYNVCTQLQQEVNYTLTIWIVMTINKNFDVENLSNFGTGTCEEASLFPALYSFVTALPLSVT